MICGRNTQESPAAVSPVMWIKKNVPLLVGYSTAGEKERQRCLEMSGGRKT